MTVKDTKKKKEYKKPSEITSSSKIMDMCNQGACNGR